MKTKSLVFFALALSLSATAQLRVLKNGHIVAGVDPNYSIPLALGGLQLKTLGGVLTMKARDGMKFSDCKILTGSNIECDRQNTIYLEADVVIEKGAVFTVK